MPNLRLEFRKNFRFTRIILAIIISSLISGGFFLSTYLIKEKDGEKITSELVRARDRIGKIVGFSGIKKQEILEIIRKQRQKSQKTHDPYAEYNTPYLQVTEETNDVSDYEKYTKDPFFRNYIDYNHLRALEIYEEIGEDFANVFDSLRNDRFSTPKAMTKLFETYNLLVNELPVKEDLAFTPNFVSKNKVLFTSLLEQNLPYEDPQYSLTGTIFAKKVVMNLFGLPLIILILIVMGVSFAEEFENNVHKLRFTQPLSRLKYFCCKVVISAAYAATLMILTIFFSYLYGGVFGSGLGSWLYPLAKTVPNKFTAFIEYTTYTIPVWKYILLVSSTLLLIVGIVFSTMMFLSVILKNGAVITTLMILTIPSVASSALKNINPLGIISFDSVTGRMTRRAVNLLNPFALIYPDEIIMKYSDFPFIALAIGFLCIAIIVLVTNFITRLSFVQNFSISLKDAKIDRAIKRFEKNKLRNKIVLLRFELLKIFRQRSLIIVILVITLGTGFYVFRSPNQYSKHLAETKSGLKWLVEAESINYINDSKTGDIESTQSKKFKEYKQALQGFKENNLEVMTLYFISNISRYRNAAFIKESKDEFILNIRLYNEIMERSKIPELPVAFYNIKPSIFSDFPNTMNYIYKHFIDIKVQPNVSFNINRIFTNGLSYILLLVITLFTGNTLFGLVSNSSTKRKENTFIRIQPASKNRIYFAKISSSFIAFAFLFSISVLTPTITLLARGEALDYDYPAIKYHNDVDVKFDGHIEMAKKVYAVRNIKLNSPEDNKRVFAYNFRDIGDENIEVILITVFTGIFILALMSIAGAGIGLMIFAAGYGISIVILKSASVFLPFIWVHSKSIVSGETNVVFNGNNFNLLTGILVMTLWTIIIIIVNMRRKKTA